MEGEREIQVINKWGWKKRESRNMGRPF